MTRYRVTKCQKMKNNPPYISTPSSLHGHKSGEKSILTFSITVRSWLNIFVSTLHAWLGKFKYIFTSVVQFTYFRDLFYPFCMLFTIILGQCYLILHIYQIFWCTVKINGQFNASVIGYGQWVLAWCDHLTTLGAWSI